MRPASQLSEDGQVLITKVYYVLLQFDTWKTGTAYFHLCVCLCLVFATGRLNGWLNHQWTAVVKTGFWHQAQVTINSSSNVEQLSILRTSLWEALLHPRPRRFPHRPKGAWVPTNETPARLQVQSKLMKTKHAALDSITSIAIIYCSNFNDNEFRALIRYVRAWRVNLICCGRFRHASHDALYIVNAFKTF